MRTNWPNWDGTKGDGKSSHRQCSCRAACSDTQAATGTTTITLTVLWVIEPKLQRIDFNNLVAPFPWRRGGGLFPFLHYELTLEYMAKAQLVVHRQCHRPRLTSFHWLLCCCCRYAPLWLLANLPQLHFDAFNRIVPLSQVRCARPKATAAANVVVAAATATDPQTSRLQVNICAKCAKWGYVMQSVNLLCIYDCGRLWMSICVFVCGGVGVSAICGVLSVVAVKMG